jgi:predicted DNA-binding transcriptional regulator YafY
MPPRDIRILFWDEKLSTKRRFTLRELQDAFQQAFGISISLRSFRTDLDALREQGAPLRIEKFELKNKLLDADMKSHYFYDTDFSLTPKQPLTAEDVERIRQATTVLKQFKHLPQFRDLEEVLFKLEHEAGIKTPVSKTQNDIIAFEQVPRLRGLERLEFLYRAITKEQVLGLYYKEFDQISIQTLLHPYFLKEFNNRWYIYGLDQNTSIVRPFALDRIERLEPHSFPFIANKSIHFSTYFDNRIGISSFRNTPIETVILRVFQPRAQYVITKPWHESQTIVTETPQYVEFQYQLIINQELEAQVLEFGKDIEVLQPVYFRTQIQTLLTLALSRY